MKLHILLCCVVSAIADMYLHNPRGSNNRLDEEGRDRNNANRLFDSQNNNRGGYNVGSVYYYTGSNLQIEWTNQHSCSSENNHCEILIQYMCGDNVRDGATTTTIPENPVDCDNYDCDTDKRYGMHESFDHYLGCKLRERNKGLFTADQRLKREDARHTRQNPNGNRRGYECPEERDYYPYWHHSSWRDIVVMTNDATRCPYYQEESQNVKSRWQCVLPRSVMYQNLNNHDLVLPNNKEDCEIFLFPENTPNPQTAQWVEMPAHGIGPPECLENQFSRDNHLGNGQGGYPLTFNWTVPQIFEENCAIRIRYNISTDDYEAWDSVDASNNKQKGADFSNLNLAPLVGLGNRQEAEDRGFVFKNNPQVQIFPGLDDVQLQLAVNTAQFARTFQDRSHTFEIRERPEELLGAVINNVNVRGKRGNIVQVYPAVEYDFVPNTVSTKNGEYLHFQWTGSNTNPPNNDGQGLQRTDRSNVVLMGEQAYSEGSGAAYEPGLKFGHWGRSYPAKIENTTFLGLSKSDLISLSTLNSHQFRGEMSELDDAGTYFDLGPRKITKRGVYHYLSTRNNNFSNRSQKGRILVRVYDMVQKSIGWNGGEVMFSDGITGVVVPQGTFDQLQNIRIERWEKEDAKEAMEQSDKTMPSGDLAGDVLVVHPEESLTLEDQTFQIKMPYSASSLKKTVVRVTNTESLTWSDMEYESDGEVITITTDQGGYYAAFNEPNAGAITGIVIGTLVIVAAIVVATLCLVRKFSPLKRAFARQI